MRFPLKVLCLLALLIHFIPSLAQDKIVLIDHIHLIDEEMDSLLEEKFKIQNLTYSTTANFKYRCDYFYTSIISLNGDNWIEIKDCSESILGRKKLSMSIRQMNKSDQAGMIVFMCVDIIDNPHKKLQEPEIVEVSKKLKRVLSDSLPKNEHLSRYYFAPTAFNLKKGELYYNTVYFALHDVQYGVSDHFSIGMGSSFAAFPFYITPKYSFDISEKSKAAVGDMFIIGTYGLNFTINLLYGTYTYGTEYHNISIGGGWLYAPENSVVDSEISKTLFNISGMTRISDHIYFLSENYFFQSPFTAIAFNSVNGPTSFTVQNNFLIGFVGMRFINKRNSVKSWQMGLAYFSRNVPEIPSTYSNPSTWNVANYPRDIRFFLPQVSFTYKFGKIY